MLITGEECVKTVVLCCNLVILCCHFVFIILCHYFEFKSVCRQQHSNFWYGPNQLDRGKAMEY